MCYNQLLLLSTTYKNMHSFSTKNIKYQCKYSLSIFHLKFFYQQCKKIKYWYLQMNASHKNLTQTCTAMLKLNSQHQKKANKYDYTYPPPPSHRKTKTNSFVCPFLNHTQNLFLFSTFQLQTEEHDLKLGQCLPGDFRGDVIEGRLAGVTDDRRLVGLSGLSPRSKASYALPSSLSLSMVLAYSRNSL